MKFLKKLLIILLFFNCAGINIVESRGLSEIFSDSMLGSQVSPQVPQIAEGSTLTEKFLYIFFNIVDGILFITGILATIFLIFAGFRLIISAGIPEQIDSAKRILFYSILGILAVILSYLIVQNIVLTLYPPIEE